MNPPKTHPIFVLEGEEESEQRRQSEMASLIARLKEQDVTISDFVLAVPVALKGTLPSGEDFTFYCRYQKCTLTVAAGTFVQTTKLDGTPFEKYETGCLTVSEATTMLAHLFGQASYTDAERRVRAVII